MRYIEVCSFFNEFDLLEIRCEETKELNPTHIIVEAPFTHQGDPKPLYFEENKQRFKKYNIVHLVCNSMPNDVDPWVNEKFQRDYCMAALTRMNLKGDEVIGIFDLDEIPRVRAICDYDAEVGVAGTRMDKYSMYLNCLECSQCWDIGRLLTWEMLKGTTPSKIRNEAPNFIIRHAGWHMSFMGGVDKMMEKFMAYAHTETLTADVIAPGVLERKYERGESLWGQDYWRFVKIDDSFPKAIRENQERYKHLIKKI